MSENKTNAPKPELVCGLGSSDCSHAFVVSDAPGTVVLWHGGDEATYRSLIRTVLPKITVPVTEPGCIVPVDMDQEIADDWISTKERLPVIDAVVHAAWYQSRRVLLLFESGMIGLGSLAVYVNENPSYRKLVERVLWDTGGVCPMDGPTHWRDVDCLMEFSDSLQRPGAVHQ